MDAGAIQATTRQSTRPSRACRRFQPPRRRCYRCGAVQDEQKKRQAKRAEDEADGAPRKPATSEPRKVTRISSTAVVAINIVYL